MSGTKICKLSEVITIQNGYAFSSKKFTAEKGIPLIRIRDLKNGITTQTKYSGDFDEAYLVKSGDLLIGMDGEFKCYEWKGGPALLNQRVCRLQNINGTFDLKYLYYGINSHLKAIEDVTGYTTVKHLSSSTILNIEFPVPSLEKQRDIVEKLDKAFAEIDSLEKNFQLKEEKTNQLLQSMLSAAFNYSKDSDMNFVKIGEVCNLMTGGTPSRSKSDFFTNGTIKWLVSGDINMREIFDCPGRITSAAMQSSNTKILPLNSVMIALNGQGKTRGTVAMLRTEATCNQSLVSIFPKDLKILIPEFIFYNLDMRYLEIRRMTGDDGNDRRGLNMSIIRDIEISLPPVEIQNNIVNKIIKISSEIEKLKNQISIEKELMSSLRQSILSNAFNFEEKAA
jgi:type I restriction enzyme S subunit